MIWWLGAACLSSNGAGDYAQTARNLLRSDKERLVVEIDAVEGLELRDPAAAWAWLETVVDKPEGIELVIDDVLEPWGSDFVWTSEDLEQASEDRAWIPDDADTAHVHVLVVDGIYGPNTVALGRAWDHRYTAIFGGFIQDVCTSGWDSDVGTNRIERACEATERGVLMHELGHLLGLVGNDIDVTTDHEDPEHRRHCIDDQCLMYWAFEGPDLFQHMKGRIDDEDLGLELDEACLDDLAAARDG